MNEPSYYTKGGKSPLTCFSEGLLTHEQYIGFLKGNVIKYTVRAGEKEDDASSDIRKAIHYLHLLNEALNTIDLDFNEHDIDIQDFKDSFNVKLDELKESISEFSDTIYDT